jgi:hypothetical protein
MIFGVLNIEKAPLQNSVVIPTSLSHPAAVQAPMAERLDILKDGTWKEAVTVRYPLPKRHPTF